MKIYTKAGDKGQTRLIGGCLVSKANERIETYGSVDELNSILGLIVATITDLKLEPKALKQLGTLREQLLRIQNELFNLGSLFACADVLLLPKLPQVQNEHITALEKEIDAMVTELEPLKNFILPGGSHLSALLHMARSTCRRAERNSVKLYEKHPEIENGLVYLNRLSDYLFTAARFANKQLDMPEQTWSK